MPRGAAWRPLCTRSPRGRLQPLAPLCWGCTVAPTFFAAFFSLQGVGRQGHSRSIRRVHGGACSTAISQAGRRRHLSRPVKGSGSRIEARLLAGLPAARPSLRNVPHTSSQQRKHLQEDHTVHLPPGPFPQATPQDFPGRRAQARPPPRIPTPDSRVLSGGSGSHQDGCWSPERLSQSPTCCREACQRKTPGRPQLISPPHVLERKRHYSAKLVA